MPTWMTSLSTAMIADSIQATSAGWAKSQTQEMSPRKHAVHLPRLCGWWKSGEARTFQGQSSPEF